MNQAVLFLHFSRANARAWYTEDMLAWIRYTEHMPVELGVWNTNAMLLWARLSPLGWLREPR